MLPTPFATLSAQPHLTDPPERFQRLPHDGPTLDNLRTELSLLKSLSHPNLVLFYGAAPIDGAGDESGVMMVMEFCRGGSLETVIDRVRVGDVSMEISWAVRCSQLLRIQTSWDS